MTIDDWIVKLLDFYKVEYLVLLNGKIDHFSQSFAHMASGDRSIKDVLGEDTYIELESIKRNRDFGREIFVGETSITVFRVFPMRTQVGDACLLIDGNSVKMAAASTITTESTTYLHKINNNLISILGFARLAFEDRVHVENYLFDIIDQSKEATRYSAILQNKLYNRDSFRSERSILDVVNELQEYVIGLSAGKHQIDMHLQEFSQKVVVNAIHIKQILKHVIKFMTQDSEKSHIAISLGFGSVDDFCDLCREHFEGNYAILSFTKLDEGELDLDNIFLPKKADLGMYVVKGMVHDQLGHIKIMKQDNLLLLFFPEYDLKSNPRQRKRILLIDKDNSTSIFIQEILESNGFFVDLETDFKKVFDIIINENRKYDSVIIEQELGGHTGIEIGSKIHKIDKDLPIIIHSNYQSQFNQDTLSLFGIRHWIIRPFSAESLLGLLRQCVSIKQV